MQLFQNIKVNYFIKQLDDLLANNKSDEVVKVLIKLANSNSKIIHSIGYKYINQLCSSFEQGSLLPKKISWINSYNLNDKIYLEKFLQTYFNQLKKNDILIGSYESQLEELQDLGLINLKKDFSLNDQVQLSYLIQFFLLAINYNKSDKILFNNSAFFESSNNLAFTHPKLTRSYVLITRNPISIFRELKQLNNQSAVLEILNRDNQARVSKLKNLNFEIHTKGWHTFNYSWANNTVINTFSGLIVRIEDLAKNTEDELIRVLFHLRQSGIDFNIDYQIIRDFIKNNPLIVNEHSKVDLSNKDIKALGELKEVCDLLGYSFP